MGKSKAYRRKLIKAQQKRRKYLSKIFVEVLQLPHSFTHIYLVYIKDIAYVCIFSLLFQNVEKKTLASTILSSAGNKEREGETNDAGCSRIEEDDNATTIVDEVHNATQLLLKIKEKNMYPSWKTILKCRA